MTKPYDLKVDHLRAPIGIGSVSPRVSWKLPAGATAQHAYRIVASDWDSGRVESSESTWVPGRHPAAVGSRRRVEGQGVDRRRRERLVRAELVGARPARKLGLDRAVDRAGRARRSAGAAATGVPARRRGSDRRRRSTRARLYATAHGVYEAFLNGTRVGDLELTPGFTAYRKRLQVQTYDVTDLVVAGDNVVGALLSDGWWRGQNSVARRVDDYGTTTALLAQLVVTLASG